MKHPRSEISLIQDLKALEIEVSALLFSIDAKQIERRTILSSLVGSINNSIYLAERCARFAQEAEDAENGSHDHLPGGACWCSSD